MTQDPQLSAQEVADLERRLADASAEVEQVRAQLARAQTGSAGPPAPDVPYGDPDPDGIEALVVDPRLRTAATSTTATPLAEPPRPVPFAYLLATFNLSATELFLLVIGLLAPLGLWIFVPEVLPAVLLLALGLVAAFRVRRFVRRTAVLRWGRLATVTRSEQLSEGTYYSGVTYHNMRLRQAVGWDATTTWYSGPGYTTQVDYTLDGTAGSLRLRGLPYAGGVILADSRDPARAMCVSQFPYSVKPGPDGHFTGRLTPWLWAGSVATLLVEATLAYVTAVAVLELWLR